MYGRESKQSWREVLLQLKAQGLEQPPELAVGDATLGFWAAGVSECATPALLGAQDGQRAQLPAPVGAAEGQGGAAGDLDGRDARAGREGVRTVHRHLRGEMHQGDRVPDQGPRRVAGGEFKLGLDAEKRWRRIRGFEKLAKIIEGVEFTDGVEADSSDRAAA